MGFKIALHTLARNICANGTYQLASPVPLAMKKLITRKTITKHIDLIKLTDNSMNDINKPKPLVVMLAWLMAKPQYLEKYAEIYINRGYNVLTVTMTPWQFFWPTTGAQLVAEELLHYLKINSANQYLVLHGFSVGAYLWGECLVKMNCEKDIYNPIVNSIKGQIWDSAPDIGELHKGLPMAIAPKNALLRSAVEKYFAYHLKTFHDSVTQHYLRSSQLFHTTPVKAPSLIFVCKNDPIASHVANKKVQEYWDSVGIKTYFKCWDKSKHVSHLILHREEYLETLNWFLSTIEAEQGQNTEEFPINISAKL